MDKDVAIGMRQLAIILLVIGLALAVPSFVAQCSLTLDLTEKAQ